MKKIFFFPILLISLFLLDCAGGSNSETCDNECTLVNSTSCSSDSIETCTQISDSCLAWKETTNCAVNELTCGITDGNAACVTSCTSDCTEVNSEQCDENSIQTCEDGGNGCTNWITTSNCTAPTAFCETQGNVPVCVGTCTSDCSAVGFEQCDVNVVEECQNSGNGCLNWVEITTCTAPDGLCEQIVNDATCVEGCTSDCTTIGFEQCNANIIEECQDSGNGCMNWTTTTTCTAPNGLCEEASNVATCVAGCTSDCTTIGHEQCDANIIKECQDSGNGCTNWTTTTTCTAPNGVCEQVVNDATCVAGCTSDCTTIGHEQCDANIIEECQDSGNGCTNWVTTSTCVAPNDLCEQVLNDATCVAGCTSDCTTIGNEQCNADTVEQCQDSGNSCKNWVTTATCVAPNDLCEQVVNDATCVSSCTNECNPPGKEQCNLNNVEECQVGGDTCNDWVITQQCNSDICTINGNDATCEPAPAMNILLITEDVDAAGLAIYATTFSNIGYSYTLHDAEVSGFPTAVELANYDTIIYSADYFVDIGGEDQFQLILDWINLGNKNIFVNGRDFMWDIRLTDPGNKYDFYLLLNTNYEADYAGTSITELVGISGDPIGDSFFATPMEITGTDESDGDYASVGSATIGMNYGTGSTGSGYAALTHYSNATYKSVWLGINFHNGISNQTDRDTLLENILNYFIN
jgi:hypothetical protein